MAEPGEAGPEPVGPPEPPSDGWLTDSRGRKFAPRPEGGGIVYRKGEETLEEALMRDSTKPKDRRPKKKPPTPRKPDAPSQVDLKELEKMLAEALKSPAMICATFGDEWAAMHFTERGPYLARNMVMASQHNPWLRRKLEEMATGGDAAMKLISLVGVGGALALYVVPPVVYFLNLPVGDKTRAMLDIPYRNPADAPSPPPAPAAAQPVAA